MQMEYREMLDDLFNGGGNLWGHETDKVRKEIIDLLGEALTNNDTDGPLGKLGQIRSILESFEKYEIAAEHCHPIDGNDNPYTPTSDQKERLHLATQELYKVLPSQVKIVADSASKVPLEK